MIKISKRIFEHTDLRIQEVRLLMELSAGQFSMFSMVSIQHLVELCLLNSNYNR